MPSAHQGTDAARLLEAVGVSAAEERLYAWLIDHPGHTLAEAAACLALDPLEAAPLLESIESKGMVTRTAEVPCRYLPVRPDIAVETLILKRREELERTRIAAAQLRLRAIAAGGAHDQHEQIVEIVSGKQAQGQVVAQLQRAAQREIVWIACPPYIVTLPDRIDADQIEAMTRGVAYRSVHDPSVLEYPGAVARLRHAQNHGANIRLYDRLPTKLIIADRDTGLVPLNMERPDVPVLLIRSSTLLDALHALFELIWERATPISFTRSGAVSVRERRRSDPIGVDRLIPLLAAGLNDKTIVDELGISVRTLERRVLAPLRGLDARTRFQAGWLAALRLHPALAWQEHARHRTPSVAATNGHALTQD
jgi:sugar-specific transcriptional regulator TrmB